MNDTAAVSCCCCCYCTKGISLSIQYATISPAQSADDEEGGSVCAEKNREHFFCGGDDVFLEEEDLKYGRRTEEKI